MNKLKSFLSVVALSVGFSANATVIELDGTEVGAYNVDSSYTSFADFYGLNTVNQWSTALPYAEVNTGVFFVAELNSNLALFGLFDSYSPVDTDSGSLDFEYSFNEGNGAYTFVDDADEMSAGSALSFNWGDYYGDGFVLFFDLTRDIDMDALVSNVTGLDNGFKFLSFDSNQASDIALASGNFNLSVNVPEPTSIAIMGLSLVGLASLRSRKAK